MASSSAKSLAADNLVRIKRYLGPIADAFCWFVGAVQNYNLSDSDMTKQSNIEFTNHAPRLLGAYNRAVDYVLQDRPRSLESDLFVLECSLNITTNIANLPNLLVRSVLLSHEAFRQMSAKMMYIYASTARTPWELKEVMIKIPEESLHRLREIIKHQVDCFGVRTMKELCLILHACRKGEHEKVTVQKMAALALRMETRFAAAQKPKADGEPKKQVTFDTADSSEAHEPSVQITIIPPTPIPLDVDVDMLEHDEPSKTDGV